MSPNPTHPPHVPLSPHSLSSSGENYYNVTTKGLNEYNEVVYQDAIITSERPKDLAARPYLKIRAAGGECRGREGRGKGRVVVWGKSRERERRGEEKKSEGREGCMVVRERERCAGEGKRKGTGGCMGKIRKRRRKAKGREWEA